MTDTGPAEPPSGGGPPIPAHHLHLLLPESEDRRLLEEWLGQRYDVTVGATADSLDREFDLCIVDEASFARHTDELVARKARDAPTFLPYLLVLGDTEPAAVDHRVWEHVDDLVAAPLDKRGLHGRLTALLARRDLSSELARREERIRQILQTIPDPLLVVDETGTVVTTNPALEDHTGADSETIVGSTLGAIESLPDETVAVLTRLTAGAHEPTADGPAEAPADGPTIGYRSVDGTMRQAEVGAADLSRTGTDERQTLFILRDVTERIDRERTLERERDRLDDFADMLAHEVRNPLNIAQGFLEAVTPGDADEADALDRVSAAHRRMAQMIKELLAHARGDLTREKQPVVLEQVAGNSWDQTPTGEATLELEAEQTTLEADPEHLQTILGNLFRNAMEHAGRSATVRVGPLDGGGFYVEDDGPGIPPEEREYVFERGYTTNSSGTGLGLALVREVAAANDWSVGIAEGTDGGARFEFRGRPATDRDTRRADPTEDGSPG